MFVPDRFLRLLWPRVCLAWPNDATALSHSRMKLVQDALDALS